MSQLKTSNFLDLKTVSMTFIDLLYPLRYHLIYFSRSWYQCRNSSQHEHKAEAHSGCCLPRQSPSQNFERISFDLWITAMSASRVSYGDFVQIRKDLIDPNLVDRVVADLHLEAIPNEEAFTTRIDWTPACSRLREFYVTSIHPKVSPCESPQISDILMLRRSSRSRTLRTLLNRQKRHSRHSRWWNVSTQLFKIIQPDGFVLIAPTITFSFLLLSKDCHPG